jgi:hypothetical protein
MVETAERFVRLNANLVKVRAASAASATKIEQTNAVPTTSASNCTVMPENMKKKIGSGQQSSCSFAGWLISRSKYLYLYGEDEAKEVEADLGAGASGFNVAVDADMRHFRRPSHLMKGTANLSTGTFYKNNNNLHQ